MASINDKMAFAGTGVPAVACAIESFGKLILCFPINTSDWFCKISVKVLAVVGASFNLLLWMDALTQSSWMTYMGATSVSGAIEASLHYFALVISDATVRWGSIFFRAEKRKMYHLLLSCPSRSPDCQHGRLLLPTLILIPTWLVASIYFSVYSEWSFHVGEDFKSLFVPQIETVVRSVYLSVDCWSLIGLLYAWTWFVVVGALLICRLEHFAEKCESRAVESNACMKWIRKSSNPVPVDLMSEFWAIKTNFETYGKIAGAYSLALVIYFGLSITGFLSIMINADDDGSLMYKLRLIYVVIYLASLTIVISFGNYVSKSVSFS